MFWVLDQGIDAQQHACEKSTPQYKIILGWAIHFFSLKFMLCIIYFWWVIGKSICLKSSNPIV